MKYILRLKINALFHLTPGSCWKQSSSRSLTVAVRERRPAGAAWDRAGRWSFAAACHDEAKSKTWTHVKVFADLLQRCASLRSTCICWKARGRRFVTCCKPWTLANRKDDYTTDARRWGPLWEQVFWAISWNVNSSKNTRVSEWFRWAHDMNSAIRYNNLPLRMTYPVYICLPIFTVSWHFMQDEFYIQSGLFCLTRCAAHVLRRQFKFLVGHQIFRT